MQVAVWNARRRVPSFVAAAPVRVAEITAPADRRPGPDGTTTLAYRLAANGSEQLEALRDARRAMIREEATRGLDEGEPSLAEAAFSATAIFWEVAFGELARCRGKLDDLVRRANGLIELRSENRVSAAV